MSATGVSGLPRVSDATAVAGWLSLSALWVPREFAGKDGTVAVSRLSPVPLDQILHPGRKVKPKPQSVGAG
jgi:hypothetical protein